MNKLFFSFLISIQFSFTYAQDSSFAIHNKNKIGLGVVFGDLEGNVSGFSASFNKALNQKNDLAIPLYYIRDVDYNLLLVSLGYQHASRVREKHFNFIIGPELSFNYAWYDKNFHGSIVNQYGCFLLIDLIPTFWISYRFTLAAELKFGYGYEWIKERDEHHFYSDYSSSRDGWQIIAFPGIRILYDL